MIDNTVIYHLMYELSGKKHADICADLLFAPDHFYMKKGFFRKGNDNRKGKAKNKNPTCIWPETTTWQTAPCKPEFYQEELVALFTKYNKERQKNQRFPDESGLYTFSSHAFNVLMKYAKAKGNDTVTCEEIIDILIELNVPTRQLNQAKRRSSDIENLIYYLIEAASSATNATDKRTQLSLSSEARVGKEKQSLREFLVKVPAVGSRSHELMLTRFILGRDEADDRDAALGQLLYDSDSQIAYNAFYCLNILLRHNKDLLKLKILFDEHAPRFKSQPTFSHLWVQLQVEGNEPVANPDELLLPAFENSQNFADNAGVVHVFPYAFISLYENPESHVNPEKWLPLALETVDRAIALDPTYAKYYCTKGRILSANGQFAEAIRLFDYAINLEDSSLRDYVLRISDYQHCKAVAKVMANVSRKLSELKLTQKETLESLQLEATATI